MAVQGQSPSCVSHVSAAPTPHRCYRTLGILGVSADQVSPSIPAGVASVVVSFFLSMYYNVINAWAFWYLFHSFQVCEFPITRFGPTAAVEGCGGFALVLDDACHHCQLGRGDGGVSKASETQSFSGEKSEAGMSSSMIFPEALAVVFPSPWNSGRGQPCDALVTCARVSCIQGWACLMAGERFGPIAEDWRVSSPGERLKEPQPLGTESVWSSARRRDRADLSLGRGSERVVPRGEDQKVSVLGERVIPKGECQKRSSPAERVIPSPGQHHAERSPPGHHPPCAPGTAALPATPAGSHSMFPLPGPPALGHLSPQQQPHGLRGGVREDFIHAVLLVPADAEHLPVAGGQRQRAVGAGAVPDAGLARGLSLHPPRHRLHRQGESGAQPCRARAGPAEGNGPGKAARGGCCSSASRHLLQSAELCCLCCPAKMQLKQDQSKHRVKLKKQSREVL